MKNKLDMKIIIYLLITFFLLVIYSYSHQILNYSQHFLSVMQPIIMGALIAYLLNLIVVRLERTVLKKMQARFSKLMRGVSILLSIIFVTAILYLIIKLIVPQIIMM